MVVVYTCSFLPPWPSVAESREISRLLKRSLIMIGYSLQKTQQYKKFKNSIYDNIDVALTIDYFTD